jgi:hypothetical protein
MTARFGFEKKLRIKVSKIKAKLEKQAGALGYTFAQKEDGGGTPPKEQAKERKEDKPASGWNL